MVCTQEHAVCFCVGNSRRRDIPQTCLSDIVHVASVLSDRSTIYLEMSCLLAKLSWQCLFKTPHSIPGHLFFPRIARNLSQQLVLYIPCLV